MVNDLTNEAVARLREQIEQLQRHDCMNCDHDNEDVAEIEGYNRALADVLNLLAAGGGAPVSPAEPVVICGKHGENAAKGCHECRAAALANRLAEAEERAAQAERELAGVSGALMDAGDIPVCEGAYDHSVRVLTEARDVLKQRLAQLEPIAVAAQEYLDYLKGSKPLSADEFDTLKSRIVTLACGLSALVRARPATTEKAVNEIHAGPAAMKIAKACK